MKKQPYRSVRVKDVDRKDLEKRLSAGDVHVGIDVAKLEAFVVLRGSAGQFERPWKVKLPGEIRELVALLNEVREHHPLVVAMEPTGSYGHALHQALSDASIEVHRVRTQATAEYAELFDGVSSNHDGKDAAMLAELCALGKSVPWPSAKTTAGLRMTAADVKYVKRVAQATWEADAAVTAAERELQKAAKADPTIQQMAPIVGQNTACVLAVTLGKPQNYHCGEAYRKAMGLNLKERSSGQQKGDVHITKRGCSLARRWLFFAALREIRTGPAKAWYERQKAKDKDRGMGAVVAVMRRLALAIYAVVRDDSVYSPARMFGALPQAALISTTQEESTAPQ